MRDVSLMTFTLHAIRGLGDGGARNVKGGRGEAGWYAGPQPLNSQALWDLVGDGWLTMAADRRAARIDAWPSFAGADPGMPVREMAA